MRMQRKLSCDVQAAPADVESVRDVVMDESTLGVHQIELVVNTRPGKYACNCIASLNFFCCLASNLSANISAVGKSYETSITKNVS